MFQNVVKSEGWQRHRNVMLWSVPCIVQNGRFSVKFRWWDTFRVIWLIRF